MDIYVMRYLGFFIFILFSLNSYSQDLRDVPTCIKHKPNITGFNQNADEILVKNDCGRPLDVNICVVVPTAEPPFDQEQRNAHRLRSDPPYNQFPLSIQNIKDKPVEYGIRSCEPTKISNPSAVCPADCPTVRARKKLTINIPNSGYISEKLYIENGFLFYSASTTAPGVVNFSRHYQPIELNKLDFSKIYYSRFKPNYAKHPTWHVNIPCMNNTLCVKENSSSPESELFLFGRPEDEAVETIKIIQNAYHQYIQ